MSGTAAGGRLGAAAYRMRQAGNATVVDQVARLTDLSAVRWHARLVRQRIELAASADALIRPVDNRGS